MAYTYHEFPYTPPPALGGETEDKHRVAIVGAGPIGLEAALYGRFLGRRLFKLSTDNLMPSHEFKDGVDYVPAKANIIFGHHFTSIAGTGPIVGPAIAVFWGWLPALLWVVFGAIFIGAVHDFGALVVSLRNRGQTVGEVAGRIIASLSNCSCSLIRLPMAFDEKPHCGDRQS